MSYYDALRFANWMHNGQPIGVQDASTTEDGAYDMSLGAAVVRKAGAKVFLPNEDEWYKAAYYKGGGTDAGYWDYATQSDTIPTLEAPPRYGHGERFRRSMMISAAAWSDPLMARPRWEPTPPSPRPAPMASTTRTATCRSGREHRHRNRRCRRGAAFVDFDDYMIANSRYSREPEDEWEAAGFRVAGIPVSPIPTVSEWGILAMSSLFLDCRDSRLHPAMPQGISRVDDSPGRGLGFTTACGTDRIRPSARTSGAGNHAGVAESADARIQNPVWQQGEGSSPSSGSVGAVSTQS